MEPRLITRPQPREHMPGPRARASRNGAFRFVSTTVSQSASSISSAGPRMLMPALLTRMSTVPKPPSTSATSRAISSDRFRSTAKAAQRLPVAREISCAAARQSSRVRLATATSAPTSARAWLIVRPSPRAPPVTSARRPSRRNRSSTLIVAALLPRRPRTRERSRPRRRASPPARARRSAATARVRPSTAPRPGRPPRAPGRAART